MKIGQTRILEAIQTLCPTNTNLTKSLSIVLENGFIVHTDEVLVDGTSIYARQLDTPEHWHFFAREDVANLQVILDPKACEEVDVNPQLWSVLEHVRKHQTR
jgi:hypothetical protein